LSVRDVLFEVGLGDLVLLALAVGELYFGRLMARPRIWNLGCKKEGSEEERKELAEVLHRVTPIIARWARRDVDSKGYV